MASCSYALMLSHPRCHYAIALSCSHGLMPACSQKPPVTYVQRDAPSLSRFPFLDSTGFCPGANPLQILMDCGPRAPKGCQGKAPSAVNINVSRIRKKSSKISVSIRYLRQVKLRRTIFSPLFVHFEFKADQKSSPQKDRK